MASFAISDVPSGANMTPSGRGGWSGILRFTVTNTRPQRATALLRPRAEGDTRSDWLSIRGDSQRVFDPGQAQVVELAVDAPPTVSPGSYRLRLRVVAEADQDNDWTDGPTVQVSIAPEDRTTREPTVFFNDGTHVITSALARFGDETVPIAQVTGLGDKLEHPGRWWGALVIVVALALAYLVFALADSHQMDDTPAWIGLAIAAGLVWLGIRRWRRSTQSLTISRAVGGAIVVTATDANFITAVRAAMEKALAAAH